MATLRRRLSAQPQLKELLRLVEGVPVVAVSGLTGAGLDRLSRTSTRYGTSVSPPTPSTARGGAGCSSAACRIRPPAQAQLNHPAEDPPADLRVVLRRPRRRAADLSALLGQRTAGRRSGCRGAPIRLTLRDKANPYAGKGRERSRVGQSVRKACCIKTPKAGSKACLLPNLSVHRKGPESPPMNIQERRRENKRE
jgi:hypothetical protein